MADLELLPKTEDSLSKNDLEGAFPAVLVRAGKAACFAADEFFSVRLSNPHTRTAYAHQVGRFLARRKDEGLELHQVTRGLASRFLDELPESAPQKHGRRVDLSAARNGQIRQAVRPTARICGLQTRPVRRSSLRWLRTLSCSK